jgi:hypothetical protein
MGLGSASSRCASAISPGVICEAATSRSCTASGSCAAAKLSRMYARTESCCTPLAIPVKESEVGLRGSIGLFGRLARPFRRFGVVLLHALAIAVHAAEAQLRAGIAMLSKRQTWLKGRRVVFSFVSRYAVFWDPGGADQKCRNPYLSTAQ